jgi:Holliday junction DNA helicase RuvB
MENVLRPKSILEYIGQKKIIATLKLFLDGVKKRGVPQEHLLLYGPAGIGKTTLAYVIAKELAGELKITSGPALQKGADLASILTNLKDKDVLFIDEIHRLPKTVEELLYPVLEEYSLDIVVGKGASARIVRLPIPKITIIGATTKIALLSTPLRERFGLILRLDYYSPSEMEEIIERSAKILNIPLTKKSVKLISERSRRLPRVANRILKRVKDIFEVKKYSLIDEKILEKLFEMLEIDSLGLTNIDLKYLKVLAEKFSNQPVGVETIASALSEDKRTIEEYIEPYLLQLGLIKKTPKGRALTDKALRHLGMKMI